MTPVPSCAVCASPDLRIHMRVAGEVGRDELIPTSDRYGVAISDIARCGACGHMQLAPMPTDAELQQAYADAASVDYVDEEAGQRETARRALERIEALAPQPSDGPRKLLDLGCWLGFLLAEARSRGWSTLGVELSTFAASYARDELGLDVLNDEFLTVPLPQRSFDAVVLGDVIEHLPRPHEALDRIGALLRPGGVLWLALPDAGSLVARALGRRWWSVLPTHVQYFTRASITTLLRSRGWEVLQIRTSPKAFTVRYYVERIGGYSRPLAAALVRSAEAAGVADRMWAPDFRDRMELIARPPG